MKRFEFVERATNINAMLKVLAAVDEDNNEAVRELPRALQLVSEYSEKLFVTISENEIEE